jgi:hypothetical protein
MADNVTLNLMTGGSVVAADDISSVFFQRIKLVHGADGVNDGDVSTSNGLPVSLLAGSAAIGKLAANSGVDIGDVDVMSIAAGDNNIGNVDIVTVPADPFGANADAAVAAGATGSIQAKLRRATQGLEDLKSLIVLAAGANAIGKLAANSGVDIGDVDVTSIAAGDNNIGNVDIVTVPADPFGANADAAVSAGATGSIQAKLRSISRDLVANIVLAAGANAIGKLAANSGVDIGDVDVMSIAAGTNLIGDVDIQPRTTGGWSVGMFTSGDTFTALTNSAQVVKGSAGKFGGYYIYNPNSSATYVLLYDVAAAGVTVGTTTPKLVFCIPATSGANLELLAGIPFGTAMAIAAATTGPGNTAPATALEAMIFYK